VAQRVSRGVRLDEHVVARIETASRDSGFSSISAFMRAAIEGELGGRQSGRDDSAERIVASLDRVARELRGIRLGQQAMFAFLDAMAKTILTCVPEPPPDVRDQAVARAKARYDRFLKSVGMAMKGDSQAALKELSRNVQED
jgi:Arc/MetJ-type ribon-helix-helix transcriptional regulator